MVAGPVRRIMRDLVVSQALKGETPRKREPGRKKRTAFGGPLGL